MLDIRAFVAKNDLRINVLRRHKHKQAEQLRAEFSYKQLGSFYLSKGYSVELLELLNTDEALQLKNWIAEMQFAKLFEGKLIKHVIRIPEKLDVALQKIHKAALAVGIEFLPNQIILETLLAKLKFTEQKIDKINEFHSHILENCGIATVKALPTNATLKVKEGRALFKKLHALGVTSGMGRVCSQLEAAASKLGKSVKIPPKQLKVWAGLESAAEHNITLKRWCFAIAIDVLLENKINPLTIIQPTRVIYYWAFQQQKIHTLEETKDLLSTTFHFAPEQKAEFISVIESAYHRI